jgi:hypothetical protein
VWGEKMNFDVNTLIVVLVSAAFFIVVAKTIDYIDFAVFVHRNRTAQRKALREWNKS